MNLFTDEQKEYFLSIVKGRQGKKLAQMMNDKFGLDVTAAQICTYKSKYGITSYYERPYARTEDAVKDFVIANAGGITNRELAEKMRNEFGREFTIGQVKAIKQRLGVRSGLVGYFEKGKPSRYKGRRLPKDLYVKMQPTMFRKGHVPANKQEIGYERFTQDGYTMVKTENGFKLKQILVYEAAHGPVPKGYKLMFADGNRQNFDLDNLVLVTHGELVTLAIKGLISDIPEITKANLARVRLMRTIKERRKGIEK